MFVTRPSWHHSPGVRFRLAALFFCVVTALGCRRDPVEPQKEPKEEGVDVKLAPKALEAAHLATAKPRVVVRRTSVTAAGKIDFVPSRVARVGPPIGGRVATIPVVPGQKVGRGALLATIESVEVGRARGDLVSARTRVEQAKAEVEREKRLVAGGASSDRALLVAETELATAKAQLQAAQDRVGTLGVATGGGGQTIALVAPIAGQVLKLDARVGQPVGPTDVLVVVGETQDVWLDVEIYERDVGAVGLGDEVRVTSIAFPGRTFDGKVDQIGATVDPDRHVLDARVVLHNADGSLKPGMTATAQILGAAQGDGGTAIVVPRGAIQTIDGQPFLFVEHGGPGKYAMHAVERGAPIGDDVEITRGLSTDEVVVVDGAFVLKSEVLKAQMGAND